MGELNDIHRVVKGQRVEYRTVSRSKYRYGTVTKITKCDIRVLDDLMRVDVSVPLSGSIMRVICPKCNILMAYDRSLCMKCDPDSKLNRDKAKEVAAKETSTPIVGLEAAKLTDTDLPKVATAYNYAFVDAVQVYMDTRGVSAAKALAPVALRNGVQTPSAAQYYNWKSQKKRSAKPTVVAETDVVNDDVPDGNSIGCTECGNTVMAPEGILICPPCVDKLIAENNKMEALKKMRPSLCKDPSPKNNKSDKDVGPNIPSAKDLDIIKKSVKKEWEKASASLDISSAEQFLSRLLRTPGVEITIKFNTSDIK